MKQIDALRMKRRTKELEAKKLKSRLNDIEDEIKEYDKSIVNIVNSEHQGDKGGFNRIEF